LRDYFAFLHVEVVDDDTDEEVESEERAEDDEEDEVHVHIATMLSFWLLIHLQLRHTLRTWRAQTADRPPD